MSAEWEIILQRERSVVGAAILGLALISWLETIWKIGPMMGMPSLPLNAPAIAFFVVTWTIGMVAMMFPTTVPMLLMFLHVGKTASPEVREGGGPSPAKALAFVASYMMSWVLVGLVIYVALAAILGLLPTETETLIASPVGIGLALILVALYQFSPVKGECLRRCHPSSFLFKYYRGGVPGSLEMGLQYARYCVGCCWVMMVFLLVAASMGVLWMAFFAGIIFVERSLTTSPWAPRIIGLGFFFSGILFVVVG